jgi:hypothetical protein
MVLSDALVEEIYQTLVKLPFATVEPLINKMRTEATQQKQPPANDPAPFNGHAERKDAHPNKSKPT